MVAVATGPLDLETITNSSVGSCRNVMALRPCLPRIKLEPCASTCCELGVEGGGIGKGREVKKADFPTHVAIAPEPSDGWSRKHRSAERTTLLQRRASV